MKKIIIIGAGGHGRSVAEIFIEQGQYSVIGFVDDAWPKIADVWGIPVLGRRADLSKFRDLAQYSFVAIGNNSLRSQITDECVNSGFDLPSVIHSRAIVSPRAIVGRGVAVMAGAVIGTEAQLEDGSIVNAGAVVDHHAIVRRFAHLGVGAAMAGGAELGGGAWIQAGVALGYGTKIPSGMVLAVPAPQTVVSSVQL